MRKGKKKSNKNKYRMLGVSRQLSPEKQAELLDLIQRAYMAEKSSGYASAVGNDSTHDQQEYSCGNTSKRSNE